jgi:hypothetical protein
MVRLSCYTEVLSQQLDDLTSAPAASRMASPMAADALTSTNAALGVMKRLEGFVEEARFALSGFELLQVR